MRWHTSTEAASLVKRNLERASLFPLLSELGPVLAVDMFTLFEGATEGSP